MWGEKKDGIGQGTKQSKWIQLWMKWAIQMNRDSKKGIETLLKTQTSSSAAKQIYVLKNMAEITTLYRRWCLTFSGIRLKFQVWQDHTLKADYIESKRKNRFIFFSFFQFFLSNLVTSLFWPWVLSKKENFALCWCSVVNIWSPSDIFLLISDWTLFEYVLFLNDFCGVLELLSLFCLMLL